MEFHGNYLKKKTVLKSTTLKPRDCAVSVLINVLRREQRSSWGYFFGKILFFETHSKLSSEVSGFHFLASLWVVPYGICIFSK